MLKFIEVIDRSVNEQRSFSGGDYCEGRIIVTSYNVPIAVRHFSSCAIAPYCHRCGRYGCEGRCGDPSEIDFAGWETGRELDGKESEMFIERFAEKAEDWFAFRKFQLTDLREIFRAVARKEVARFYANAPAPEKSYSGMTRDELLVAGVHNGARLAIRAVERFVADIS